MNRIKELRQAQNMKQSDLARLLNCTDVTVARYELEKRALNPDLIDKLCKIFNCTADYLLNRSCIKNHRLTEEEYKLVEAYRRADYNARTIVDLALQPFSEAAAQFHA